MQTLPMSINASQNWMCYSNKALVQMAKAKFQHRRVLLKKLWTGQLFKNESQLFISSNLQLFIAWPITVPKGLLGPNCISWKL